MRFITFISFLIVVAWTACATTNSKTTHSHHNMIQLEQIREQLASDAYDLIRKLIRQDAINLAESGRDGGRILRVHGRN